MNCSSCGRKICDDNFFCNYCGSKVRNESSKENLNALDGDVEISLEHLLRLQVNLLSEIDRKLENLKTLQKDTLSLQDEINREHYRTKLIDVTIPFWSMVEFMVKWSIAAIPAGIILFVFGLVLWAIFGTMLADFVYRVVNGVW